MRWKTLDDMDLSGKRVLVRVDINVPVKDGQVTDASRIERTAPTIRDILAKGGSPILLAHFGRPKGQPNPDLSLRQLLPALEAAFGVPVTFMEHPSRAAIDALPGDAVVLLENTRFSLQEEANHPNMAKFLAGLGDIFVNDAFSAAHRAHASTTGVAELLPNCAGRLMAEELDALEKALGDPERPVIAIVGGAKVSTKLDLLGNLVRQVDMLVIGGGMANTFLAATGLGVGTSLCEHDMAAKARAILAAAEASGCEVILPVDVAIAPEFAPQPERIVVPADAVPPGQMILDAGPETGQKIRHAINKSNTLVMNGPLGVFEMAPFGEATFEMVDLIATRSAKGKLVSVAGGGDTVSAINRAGRAEDFTYISTAGGAFLEWMEGKDLPGVSALIG